MRRKKKRIPSLKDLSSFSGVMVPGIGGIGKPTFMKKKKSKIFLVFQKKKNLWFKTLPSANKGHIDEGTSGKNSWTIW